MASYRLMTVLAAWTQMQQNTEASPKQSNNPPENRHNLDKLTSV